MRSWPIRWVLPLVLVGAAGVGAAMAATASLHSTATVRGFKSVRFGVILVNSSGRTLYRYTPDSKGVNRCSSHAVCAKYWPALLVKAGSKPTASTGANAALLGTMAAAHGMRQVTYAGYPLYTFAGDTRAGLLKGQGFEGIWYVVSTKGLLVKRPISTTQTAPTTTTAPAPSTTDDGGGGGWG